MSLILPAIGEQTCIGFMLGVTVPGNQLLHLYINNVAPTSASTLASFTEMSTLGYAALTLTKTSWVVSAQTGHSQAAYANQTWTFTAGTAVSAYGYYITDATTGALLWQKHLVGRLLCQTQATPSKLRL